MVRSGRFSFSGRRRRAATAFAILAVLAAPAASRAATATSGVGGIGSGGVFGSLRRTPAFAQQNASPAASAKRVSPVSVASQPSGGGGLSSSSKQSGQTPPPPGSSGQGHWLSSFTISEYWPVPESWFVGKLVKAPGLPGLHRVDWLYSAMGMSMEGDGIGLDGQTYHIDALGSGGWITASGKATSASNGFKAGSPFWRAGGYWRNAHGGVTFPLAAGGWYAGPSKRYVPLPGVSFAPGPSLPLHYLQSIAVDPKVIPLGSRVYLPAYQNDGHGGWFIAQDTGGAINGHHIDVYRRPPSSPDAGGQYLTSQRVYVIKPQ